MWLLRNLKNINVSFKWKLLIEKRISQLYKYWFRKLIIKNTCLIIVR